MRGFTMDIKKKETIYNFFKEYGNDYIGDGSKDTILSILEHIQTSIPLVCSPNRRQRLLKYLHLPSVWTNKATISLCY